MDKIHWPRQRVPQRLCSADLELFVAEVGDDFEDASEGGDVAVEGVDAGEFAVFSIWLSLSRMSDQRTVFMVAALFGGSFFQVGLTELFRVRDGAPVSA